MREHPIPQDVTAYRFHIVGNMTIKQFAEVGAGCVLAFLVNTTNLPVFIKWPLIGLCVGLGAMIAFVPIEERPLDHWVITFFKVLYKPTQFFWKREVRIPDPFLYKNDQNTATTVAELDWSPVRRERIKEYIGSLENPLNLDPEEFQEQQRIQQIMSTFQTVTTRQVESVKMPQKPDLAVRVRDLREQNDDVELPDGSHVLSSQLTYTETYPEVVDALDAAAPLAQLPLADTVTTTTPVVPSVAPPEPQLVGQTPGMAGINTSSLPSISLEPTPAADATATLTNLPRLNTDIQFNQNKRISDDADGLSAEDVLLTLPQLPDQPESATQAKGAAPIDQPTAISVPDVGTIRVERNEVPVASAVNPSATPQTSFEYSTVAMTPTATAATQLAQVNPTLPFPSRPTEPNKLVGMVLRPNNSVVDNAIIEIQTSDGRVARAVKTNALGQFFVTTPLQDNLYTLLVDKDGLEFPPLQIELNGSVVDPLEIRSLN